MSSTFKSSAILLSVIAVAAVAVWILRVPGAAKQVERHAWTRVESDVSSDASEPAQSPVGAGTARVRAAASTADASEARASAVAIEVIHATTRAPVPGARILWWPARAPDRVRGTFDSWLRQSAVEGHSAEAIELQADEQGLARLPDARSGGDLVAHSGALWGHASAWGENGQRITIAVAVDAQLEVLVVDARGEGVPNVTVALRQPGHSVHRDHVTARADSNGKAVLRHLGEWPEVIAASNAGIVVTVQGLMDPPCARPLTRALLESGSTVLELRPHGACEVELTDRFGRPFSAPYEARLCFEGRASGCETIAVPAGERAVFETVELERELAVEVTRAGAAGVLTARGRGPNHAGERVRFTLAVESESAILVGRLVDVRGKSLDGVELSAQLETIARTRHGDEAWSPTTGSDGRFTLELRASPAAPNEIVLALSARRTQGGTARVVLPASLTTGYADLGDVVLEDTPIAVEGVVVDVHGTPVADALITTSPAEDSPQSAAQIEPVSARSDPVGRFAVRGEFGHDSLVVRARKPGYADQFARARAGTRTLHVVLEPAGTVAGTVLLDASLQASAVLVDAELSGARAGAAADAILLGPDGNFTLRDLPLGTCNVRVIHAASGSVLGRIDGVSVGSDGERRDPRLDPLDLREPHRLIELELVDATGAPVRGGSCSSRVGDEAPVLVTPAAPGRLTLLYSGRPLDVCVSAAGFMSVDLARVAEFRRVVMQPAARVRLQLARGGTALASDLQLIARLTPVAASAPSIPSAVCQGEFDQHGSSVCEIGRAGDVRVALLLTTTTAGRARTEVLPSATPKLIHVEAHGAEQLVVIEFDPEDLMRAVAAVRGED
ncbi:MAG: hypothetical protein JNL28_17550 [Planctomycetes bacterium]|nr:hypothetical protein [Planctomycetota bacterium]